MTEIVEIQTEKGLIKKDDLMIYDGTEGCIVNEIASPETLKLYSPLEGGKTITVNISDSKLQKDDEEYTW